MQHHARIKSTHTMQQVKTHRAASEHTSEHTMRDQVLKKADIRRKNQFKYVKAERAIMATVDCPFVVKLICSFQTRANLYLVMEYVQGGDCYTLLQVLVCMYACMAACMYVCMYGCMRVCMHVWQHACMYAHIRRLRVAPGARCLAVPKPSTYALTLGLNPRLCLTPKP
jgi:hypothetical protein